MRPSRYGSNSNAVRGRGSFFKVNQYSTKRRNYDAATQRDSVLRSIENTEEFSGENVDDELTDEETSSIITLSSGDEFSGESDVPHEITSDESLDDGLNNDNQLLSSDLKEDYVLFNEEFKPRLEPLKIFTTSKAITESEALKLDILKLLDEDTLEKPERKLTNFSVHDKDNNLCPFDGDLIPKGYTLYTTGYMKRIDDDNPTTEGGILVARLGPIIGWWIAGLNEGEKATIGFSSESAHYYLVDPSPDYESFMENVRKKIFSLKVVVEFYETTDEDEELTYENLLKYMKVWQKKANIVPYIGENTLLEYADFIYERMLSHIQEDASFLVKFPFMRKLAEARKPIARRRTMRSDFFSGKERPKIVKATTTVLVENIFQHLFSNQMNKTTTRDVKQCYVALTPLERLKSVPDCFKTLINRCKEKNVPPPTGPFRLIGDKTTPAFSDHRIIEKMNVRPFYVRVTRMEEKLVQRFLKSKDAVELRKRNAAFLESGKRRRHSLQFDEDDVFHDEDRYTPKKTRLFKDKNCSWEEEPTEICGNKAYFQSMLVGEKRVEKGNFITTCSSKSFAHIKYLWEDDDSNMFCHVQWFMQSFDTILGDVGKNREIFLLGECDDIDAKEVEDVVDVTILPVTSEWRKDGNWSASKFFHMSSSYFCQKRYICKTGRFEDFDLEELSVLNGCSQCARLRQAKEREIPKIIGKIKLFEAYQQYVISAIQWRDEELRPGDCVFLPPGTLRDVQSHTKPVQVRDTNYDKVKYPEKYRKALTKDEDTTPTEPLEIGFITGISSKKNDFRSAKDVRLTVKKFYRPHNTHLDEEKRLGLDVNILYWSEEECVLRLDKVECKCFVSYEDNLEAPVEVWSQQGPYRFYFNEAYDFKKQEFIPPPSSARKIGRFKNKETNKSTCNEEIWANAPPEWPEIPRPLRSFDVFAGCGGLSLGLHQAGIAECHWAIDKVKAPARAFQKNFSNAKVFIEDCNIILEAIMKGEGYRNGVELPKKGEVELLCGGPPCQGFSGMNRFSEREYSQLKNSLMVSFLSYCDYFRPEYFLLENVRTFASYKGGIILKLTLLCLLDMGYQVTFAVLQSGKYGIPQTRRRTIILAAAPGRILPMFPEPTHGFIQNKLLDIKVDSKKFVTDLRWMDTAPYEMIRVKQAISDLPKIENNNGKRIQCYGQEPLTHFQKLMRGLESQPEDVLSEHICKSMSSLILARISFIPREPNADWRDLPNVRVKLNDGTYTKELEYTHRDARTKMSKGGVCICATHTNKCNYLECKKYKQTNTLIPWGMVHTASRHHHHKNMYGRLSWDGWFRTVVTNPQPSGKQGCVIHPDQNRIVSVRESARSQGFPDSFQFYGKILDRYAQIGNAVAPPLAKAIGLEIRKAHAAQYKLKMEVGPLTHNLFD